VSQSGLRRQSPPTDTVSSMAADAEFNFSAEVWEHTGRSSWFFVSLPEDVADDIDEPFPVHRGASVWPTELLASTPR